MSAQTKVVVCSACRMVIYVACALIATALVYQLR